MARSTLNTTGESRTSTRKGHGTRALGPSDSSDSGSDIVGGPGLNRDDGLPLARGTTSDPDIDTQGATAGADLGDADLDGDSDRYGTGERGAAGRDASAARASIGLNVSVTTPSRSVIPAAATSSPIRIRLLPNSLHSNSSLSRAAKIRLEHRTERSRSSAHRQMAMACPHGAHANGCRGAHHGGLRAAQRQAHDCRRSSRADRRRSHARA